jgi:hypothetical protein
MNVLPNPRPEADRKQLCSSLCGEFEERGMALLERGEVARLVVGDAVDPAAKENSYPLEGKGANGGVTRSPSVWVLCRSPHSHPSLSTAAKIRTPAPSRQTMPLSIRPTGALRARRPYSPRVLEGAFNIALSCQ